MSSSFWDGMMSRCGRPRTFDTEQALDKALGVFWEQGFTGASLADLTKEMGINKPSLYAAFGNKEELFIKSLQHYIESYVTPHIALLTQPGHSLYYRLGSYLGSVIKMQCSNASPRGCFVSLCANESCGDLLPPKAHQAVLEARKTGLSLLEEIFSHTELKADFSPEKVSLYLLNFLHGTAVLARSGIPYEDLEPLIEMALCPFATRTGSR